MNADDYNVKQVSLGKLTAAHITRLVRAWQEASGLVADGMAGPVTIASLDARVKLRMPLPALPDGRLPEITSEFRPADRPTHNGIDLFYRWKPGDKPNFVGDHGAAGRNSDGTPRWGVPPGVFAIASGPGVVQLADNSATGYRCWIDHGDGWRTGYFHLLDLRVKVGQRVDAGTELGLVGDNPSDDDARHLHFELSPVDRYDPIDPAPHLTK